MIMVQTGFATQDLLAPVGTIHGLELNAAFKTVDAICNINVSVNNSGAANLTKDLASVLSQLVHGVNALDDVEVAGLEEKLDLSLIGVQRSWVLELGDGIHLLVDVFDVEAHFLEDHHTLGSLFKVIELDKDMTGFLKRDAPIKVDILHVC